MSEQRVGVIGVGNMGGRISRRILDSGRPLVGYDRSPEQLERFGVPGAVSIADLVGRSDVILFSLPDSRVVEPVVFDDDGVLAACSPGQLVADLSTASPSSTVRIHAAFLERGVDFLDAGISGGAAAAEKGTLSIMVGGSDAALDRARDLFSTFASNVYHMGSSGSGHTAKLLNNFLNGVSLAATAEVMVAARKAGLDLTTFLDAVNHSSGVNFATLNRFPSIIRGDYLEGGLTGRLMTKDIQLYVELLGELGVPSTSAPGCLAAFGLAIALGYGDEISNRVVDAIGDVAGGVRLHEPAEG